MEIHATKEPKIIEPPLPHPCDLRDLMIPEDVELIDNLPVITLFTLITCANYMDIPGLMNILSVKIALLIKGKTTEEIKKTFGIDEITPEEEEQVREEYKDLLDLYSDK
jgi:S-phase kinase-associated protein 1